VLISKLKTIRKMKQSYGEKNKFKFLSYEVNNESGELRMTSTKSNDASFSKLIRALEHLGIPLNVDDFESRIRVQKVAYILEFMGVNLGYLFNLYVHGPYSPQLALDYYHCKEGSIGEELNCELSKEEKDVLKRIKKVVKPYTKSEILEGMSTILYLIKEGKIKEPDEAFEILKELKPNLTEKDITLSINGAKMLLFDKTKVTEEMKKELEELEEFGDFFCP